MEIDDETEEKGQPTTTAPSDEANKRHDEIADPAYVQKLLASNPVFAALLQDVKVLTAVEPLPAVREDDSAAGAGAGAATAASSHAVANSDRLEISLRSHAVQLLDRVLSEPPKPTSAAASSSPNEGAAAGDNAHKPVSPALSELGEFWKSSVQLCRHVVHFAPKRYDKCFMVPAVRKLAFVLLEDILEGLTLRDAQAFWMNYFAPMHPLLLKLDAGSPSSNLVFLKTLNAFWKRCGSSTNGGGGTWAATVLQTLAASFSLGERSATRVWGSRNLDTISDFDTGDQYQQHLASAASSTTTAPAEAADVPRVDYSVYQSLWSLQQDFSSPYIKNVGVFLSRVKTVLEAMETATPQPASSAPISNNAAITGKYLTHARLLPYQLQDPEFRAHVLTQFLIVANHVSAEAPGVGSQLEESRQRAIKLVSATHPQLLSALNYILRISEPQWCAWKKNKFPDMDVKARKRPRRDSHPTPTSARKVRRKTDAAPPLLDLRKELPSICAPLQAPTLEDHLVSHEYIDALDPDAGIEDEYHPKSNPYFCWQALRLLPVGDLDKVSFRTGDFEAAVRHIWKRDKGIDIPKAAAALEAAPEKGVDDDAAVDDADVCDAAADDAVGASDAESFFSGTIEVVLESDGQDSSMIETRDKVNGVDDTLVTTDAPMDAVSSQENEDDADMDVVGEDSYGPAEEVRKHDEPSERKDADPEATAGPVPDSRNGQTPVVAAANRESSGPKAPHPSHTNPTNIEATEKGVELSNPQALPKTLNVRGTSISRRADPHPRPGPGPDPSGTEVHRAEGPPNRNRVGSFGDRPRLTSGSPPPQDSGRRGSRDDIVLEHGRQGSDGQAPRGGGSGRGGGRGGSITREDRNGGMRARDGGGRGPPPPPSRDDRGAPQRGRDDRAPPPGRDTRAPLTARDDRGPPPPPGRDDRGPAPRREERIALPPAIEGGPSARDDRFPHPPAGRRDERGPPPSLSATAAGGGRDDRNGPGGRRLDDRWVRGDRPQERREGGGGTGGGGGGGAGGGGPQGRRGVSRDGPRQRR